jgi:hypothetical protein
MGGGGGPELRWWGRCKDGEAGEEARGKHGGGLGQCWRIKDVSLYDPQAYEPTPFSPWDSQGSWQSAEQGDYKRLIYLYTLATQTLTMIKLENN